MTDKEVASYLKNHFSADTPEFWDSLQEVDLPVQRETVPKRRHRARYAVTAAAAALLLGVIIARVRMPNLWEFADSTGKASPTVCTASSKPACGQNSVSSKPNESTAQAIAPAAPVSSGASSSAENSSAQAYKKSSASSEGDFVVKTSSCSGSTDAAASGSSSSRPSGSSVPEPAVIWDNGLYAFSGYASSDSVGKLLADNLGGTHYSVNEMKKVSANTTITIKSNSENHMDSDSILCYQRVMDAQISYNGVNYTLQNSLQKEKGTFLGEAHGMKLYQPKNGNSYILVDISTVLPYNNKTETLYKAAKS